MVIIGLTPAVREPQRSVLIPRIYANEDYFAGVLRAGGLPVLLPLTTNPEQWEAMLDSVDGLLFTGGADVSPKLYSEEQTALCGETAPKRDGQESYLMRRAVERKLPFLAICRGEQIMNCALGGSLYQDIETQTGSKLIHPCYDHPKDVMHGVSVTPETLLSRLTGSEIMVNSRHHQAVKAVGKGLTVNCQAPDGIVEGLEITGHPFALGVQWHPESLADTRPEAQALFDGLVRAARGEKV